MTDLLFDKLAYKDKLTASGIPEAQARAHGDALDEALRESVATKNRRRHLAQRPHDRARQAEARLDRPHGRDGRRDNCDPRQPQVFG